MARNGNRGANLPEHKTYVDDGCTMHPTGCLASDEYPECPLRYCRYDHPAQEQIARTYERWAKIMELKSTGLATAAIADALGFSKTTVRRVVRDGLGAAVPKMLDNRLYEDSRALVDSLQTRPPLVRAYRRDRGGVVGPPPLAVSGRTM